MSQITLTSEITKTKIKVTSDSTIFIDIVKEDCPSIDEILRTRKKLIKVARAAGTKLACVAKSLEDITSNVTTYEKQALNHLTDFSILRAKWLNKLEPQNGIFTGYSNDEYLQSIFKLQGEFEASTYRNTALSKMLEAHKNRLHYIEKIEGGETYYKIGV